jgi:hypothetical protein
MNAVVPTATNAASTGSEGYSYGFTANIFKRQDYGANSTNFVTYATGSGGLTASLNYAGTGAGGASQTFGMSWATDDSGGVCLHHHQRSGQLEQLRHRAQVPQRSLQPDLPERGEYWLAVQHSSTTATSNSNVTLLSFSKLLQQWPVVSMGSFGGSATLAFSGVDGIGIGVASAITTNTTMPASVVSASTQPLVYFASATSRENPILVENATPTPGGAIPPCLPSGSTTASWRSPPFASSRAGAGRSRTR